MNEDKEKDYCNYEVRLALLEQAIKFIKNELERFEKYFDKIREKKRLL